MSHAVGIFAGIDADKDNVEIGCEIVGKHKSNREGREARGESCFPVRLLPLAPRPSPLQIKNLPPLKGREISRCHLYSRPQACCSHLERSLTEANRLRSSRTRQAAHSMRRDLAEWISIPVAAAVPPVQPLSMSPVDVLGSAALNIDGHYISSLPPFCQPFHFSNKKDTSRGGLSRSSACHHSRNSLSARPLAAAVSRKSEM